MKLDHSHQIVGLRLAVGLLGEQEQSAWWPSGFLGRHAQAFLNPIFGTKTRMAQYHGGTTQINCLDPRSSRSLRRVLWPCPRLLLFFLNREAVVGIVVRQDRNFDVRSVERIDCGMHPESVDAAFWREIANHSAVLSDLDAGAVHHRCTSVGHQRVHGTAQANTSGYQRRDAPHHHIGDDVGGAYDGRGGAG